MKRSTVLGIFGLVFLCGTLLTHESRAGYVYTLFDVPGSDVTLGRGINESGEVTGSFEDVAGLHGFLRNPVGRFTVIDVPGALLTDAWGVNRLGEIAGAFVDANGGSHGFLRGAAGGFILFDVPGAIGTNATAINDRGWVTGTYDPGGGSKRWGSSEQGSGLM